MVGFNISTCPNCGDKLKYYDSVPRHIRSKGRSTHIVRIRRFRCSNCRKIHREIPNDICPHKQYESEIIRGVLDGFITSSTFGYEDYPCEMTMRRWRQCTYEQLHLNQFFDMEVGSEFIFAQKLHVPL
jgi:hypothetical protein